MRGFNQIVVKQLASCDKFLFHLETIFKWLGFFLKSQNTYSRGKCIYIVEMAKINELWFLKSTLQHQFLKERVNVTFY